MLRELARMVNAEVNAGRDLVDAIPADRTALAGYGRLQFAVQARSQAGRAVSDNFAHLVKQSAKLQSPYAEKLNATPKSKNKLVKRNLVNDALRFMDNSKL